MSRTPFIPVIPAGGAGTRLWPLSRRSHPKFLLDLTGTGRSLLQQTVDRLAPLADARPIVVTGAQHLEAVTSQLGDAAEVVGEPGPRNSMPAIALAAALVERENPETIIGSFAADHLIADAEGFARSLERARRAAELGYLVTLGVAPTHPATGFGYIEQAPEPPGHGAPDEGLVAAGACPVQRFVEKPDRALAERFLSSQSAPRFLWNAGMFVARAGLLLDALAEQIPPLAAGARQIAAAHGSAAQQEVMTAVWPRLLPIAIDHALAEPLATQGRVAVVRAEFDWDDVGDFHALARQLRTTAVRGEGVHELGGDDNDVRVLGAATVDAVSSSATVYGSTHRHIALVGVEGISVVDTEDALLVLADEHAQSLTDLVADLDDSGPADLR